VVGSDDESRAALLAELEHVERELQTAAGSIDMGAKDQYLSEGPFALHAAITGLADVVRRLVDTDTGS
jgi:hypothetical protein